MSSELQHWRVVRAETVFNASPWFSVDKQVLELPEGRIIDGYYRIEQRDFVSIVPVRADGLILGLWRYKHGPQCVNLGVPAGIVELGEEALAAAQRELAEECALASAQWKSLGSFCMDGNRSGQHCHIFAALNCEATAPRDSDDLEEARPSWLSRAEWQAHLENGDVATAGAALAIMRFLSQERD